MKFFANLRSDLPASVVVFFVAVPLCLGIALASGAPPLAGLIAGIVGGIVVGALSGSPLGVSGPAAGLAATAPRLAPNRQQPRAEARSRGPHGTRQRWHTGAESGGEDR